MKAIILAGGTGTRLGHISKVVNKHLLPIYDRPMIFFPIQTLINAKILSIMIVTDKTRAGDFMHLLGSGRFFGARFTYGLQDEAAGIADAISVARDFANKEDITVILGDNIFLGKLNLSNNVNEKAKIFLKRMNNTERFGVAVFEKDKIIDIVEKPAGKVSNYVVTGLYQYPPDVFDFIDTLSPSERNELEVTDLNKLYLKESRLSFEIVRGGWIDAGTVESLFEAQIKVRKLVLKNAKKK